MLIYSNFNNGRSGVGCLIFGILGLVLAYYVLKGVFTLLWWAAPFLFVLTVLINWRVVAEAGKALIGLFRRQPLSGVIVAVLATVAFPITALFLFLSALGSRGKARPAGGWFEGQQQAAGSDAGKATDKEAGEFIDFEEIDSEPLPSQEPLTKPEPPEKEPKKPENPYDNLFRE